VFGGRGSKRTEDERGGDMPEPNKGLPDSDTGSGQCPRCGTLSSFETKVTAPLTFDGNHLNSHDQSQERTFIDRLSVLYCRHCHQGVVVVEEQYVGDQPARLGLQAGGSIRWKGIHWWPLPSATSMPDVPAKVARVFGEACQALHARCLSSTAVMGRRTVEAVTEDKGSSTGTLKQRIDDMGKRGVLQPSLVDWATQVRLIGNAGAHFDPIEEVTEGDAQALIRFTREFLKYLYELPAELGRQRGGKVPGSPSP